MTRAGLDNELVKPFLPPTALQAAQTLDALEEARSKKSAAESDAAAMTYLQSIGIKMPGPKGAQQMLVNMTLADRAAGQARSLAGYNQDREDTRAGAKQATELAKIETDMRKNWEDSPVVKQAQAVAFSHGKLKRLEATPAPSGATDRAIVYAFINMQDNTAAREGEQKAMEQAGGLENYIKTRFQTGSRWKMGELFTPEVRQRILAAADEMANAQKDVLGGYSEWTNRLAKESGLKPENVTYDPYEKTMQAVDDEIRKDRIRRARAPR
jgi:hypothetical protein